MNSTEERIEKIVNNEEFFEITSLLNNIEEEVSLLEKDIIIINKKIAFQETNKKLKINIEINDKFSKELVKLANKPQDKRISDNNEIQRVSDNMRDAFSNFGISMNQAAINFRNFGTALNAVNRIVD